MVNQEGSQSIESSPSARRGALKGRIVANLVGVSPSTLSKWHREGLLKGFTIGEHHNGFRLYSFVDYVKIRLARKLNEEGVSWRELRRTIEYLEENEPDWYRVTLHGFAGKAFIERAGEMHTIGSPSQLAFGLIVKNALLSLEEEGPLGRLKLYDTVIDMNPDVLAANPVIKGTMIEATFIARLVKRGVSISSIMRSYRLSETEIARVVEFVQAVA